MNISDKFRTWALKILVGIFGACLLLEFLLDTHYSRNPKFPDPSIGRIFGRGIKAHGTVYLTPDQYEPYRWLDGTVFVCALLIVLIYATYFILNRLRRPHEKDPIF